MTSSSGISLPQWYARYGVPEPPVRFRDDGVPSLQDHFAAGHAFALTTPTAEQVRKSGAPALWPGVMAGKLSRRGRSHSIVFMILIVEPEDVAVINQASDPGLAYVWREAVSVGQVAQIET